MFTSAIIFILLGYLSGSVLYARVFAKLFGKDSIFERSADKNPGTSNAFRYGGFRCGALTLIFDLCKGALPVLLYVSRFRGQPMRALSLVMAAPVIGHAFPLFYSFAGGKGIATTFGALLGLLPIWQPVLLLAVWFIVFSTVLRIIPHYHRTLVTYCAALLCMPRLVGDHAICIGFFIITCVVFVRMLLSTEKKDKMRMRFLWMH